LFEAYKSEVSKLEQAFTEENKEFLIGEIVKLIANNGSVKEEYLAWVSDVFYSDVSKKIIYRYSKYTKDKRKSKVRLLIDRQFEVKPFKIIKDAN
jgi:hypothetical protein